MHLIINISDIQYITGMKLCASEAGYVAIVYDPKRPVILCDIRMSGIFDANKFDVVDTKEGWKRILSRYKTLFADPNILTPTLQEKLEKFGPKILLKKSPVAASRLIKKPHEIQFLSESMQMNKKVHEMILPFLTPGVTEEYIARKIQIFQLELGASGASFSPVVAFGENTSIPHHSPTKRKLLPTDIILLDMGLVYQGYCSDMTRMVIQSDVPEEARKIAELVTEVTHEIIRHVKPGVKVADLDKKARKMLGKYAEYFTHSLGHGVGIDIHEAPHVSGKSQDILQSGMVITIEPGIYITGKYGARYEEMIVVTGNGSEIL